MFPVFLSKKGKTFTLNVTIHDGLGSDSDSSYVTNNVYRNILYMEKVVLRYYFQFIAVVAVSRLSYPLSFEVSRHSILSP